MYFNILIMTDNNANVFVSSMIRIDKRLKYYGEGSISNISLLKMIYKYACYSSSYDCLQKLDAMVSILQQKDPEICMNVINSSSSGFFPASSPSVSIPSNSSNTAPTVNANSITVSATTYTFSASEFLQGFTDAEGDGPGNIVIKTLPAAGVLKLSGNLVSAGQVITQANVPNLTYTRDANTSYSSSFTWSVFDNNQNPMQSSAVTMSISVLANTDNIPATIGDNTIYSENREVTILTLSMFTTDTVLPYSDVEGDLLHSIRIDDISLDNVGEFTISGIPIVVGDIITRAQIEAGEFIHTGPDQDAVSSDVFAFSARDSGSMVWVQ